MEPVDLSTPGIVAVFEPVSVANLQHGRLVTIGAGERSLAQDRHRHPQAMASQQGSGIPVFGAGFGRQHRRHAQGAKGAGRQNALGHDADNRHGAD